MEVREGQSGAPAASQSLGAASRFPEMFELLTRRDGGRGYRPLSWQRRLFDRFMAGDIPAACDLPTGLGKTSVMTIWLAARALGAKLPRRLVYVVDRRAVVDQATEEAERLAANLARPEAADLRAGFGLSGTRLPVSTLRGQFADNRAWLDDPVGPGIVVATVDMTGSRLLFSGYGVSPRQRPVHAAMLGNDALVVLDEAHLVPPFQALIEQVEQAAARHAEAALFPIPRMRTMALSATGRPTEKAVFALQDEDREDAIVAERLGAPKWLSLEDTDDLAKALAERAWQRADGKHRVIVFCDSRREVAEKVYEALKKALPKGAKLDEHLDVNFQEVVHSARAGNADVARPQ